MEVKDRQKRVLFLYQLGLKSSTIVEMVSQEFNCSERTVWRDWKTRDEWMPTLSPSDAAVEAFQRYCLDMFMVREYILKDIDNYKSYAKVKVLKLLVETMENEFQHANRLNVYGNFNRFKSLRNLVTEYRLANGGDTLESDLE